MTGHSLRLAAVTMGLALISGRVQGAEDSLARFLYPLAKTAGVRTPTIQMDLDEVSDDRPLQDWAAHAKQLSEEWFPIVCRFLATDNWTPPKTIRIVVKKDFGPPGATSGATIQVSAKWIRNHPDDFGMVIHEMTHVIQNYPPGTQPGWLIEGMADYIRYWKYEPEKPHPRLDPAKASYRDGYGTTAAFLAWIVWKYDKRIVRRLDEAMRHQHYTDAIFQETSGKDLDSLWKEFAGSQKP